MGIRARWDYVRSSDRGLSPQPEDEKPAISRNLKPLIPLLGQWEEEPRENGQSAHHSRLGFQWVEYLDLITVRLDVSSPDQEPAYLGDAYLYHHLVTNTLRCLALTHSVGVYEGDVTLLPDRALECDLRAFGGDL